LSSESSPPPASLKGLSNRLKIKTPMVRKIAIMDLIHRHEELGTAQAAAVLLEHLGRETQAALQVRVIDFLGKVRCSEARETLEALAGESRETLEALAGESRTDPAVTVAAVKALGAIKASD
jgi:hypothetical protein